METKFTNEKMIVTTPCEREGWVNIECEKGIIGRVFWGDFPTELTREEAIANARLFAKSNEMFDTLYNIANGTPPATEREAFIFVELAKNMAEEIIKKATE